MNFFQNAAFEGKIGIKIQLKIYRLHTKVGRENEQI